LDRVKKRDPFRAGFPVTTKKRAERNSNGTAQLLYWIYANNTHKKLYDLLQLASTVLADGCRCVDSPRRFGAASGVCPEAA
jgi:hypothetical protein